MANWSGGCRAVGFRGAGGSWGPPHKWWWQYPEEPVEFLTKSGVPKLRRTIPRIKKRSKTISIKGREIAVSYKRRGKND